MKRPPKMDYAPIVSHRQQREWVLVLVGVIGPFALLALLVLFMRWAGGQG